MAKLTVTSVVKEKRRNGECWQNEETPQTVDKFESFADQIRKAFDEFDITYGAAYKVLYREKILKTFAPKRSWPKIGLLKRRLQL